MMRKWFIILLFLIGIGLILSPFIKEILVLYATKQPHNISYDQMEQNKQAEVTFNFEDVTPIRAADVVTALNEDLPIIGEMIVPSVDLHLPIIKGVSNSSMSVGAGTLKEGQQMGQGNFALASHHMRNPKLLFSPLDKVELDDRIYLRDADHTYIYKVIGKKIINPDNIEVIEDKEDEILVTLITCNADGTKRLMVVGEFVKVGEQ